MNAYAIPGIPRRGIVPDFDFILQTISIYFNVPEQKITGKDRKRGEVICRQILIYLCCHHYKHHSLNQIGKKLNNRDHTTIIYSRDFIIGQMTSIFDSPFKIWVKEIIAKLEQGVEILN